MSGAPDLPVAPHPGLVKGRFREQTPVPFGVQKTSGRRSAEASGIQAVLSASPFCGLRQELVDRFRQAGRVQRRGMPLSGYCYACDSVAALLHQRKRLS